MKKFLLIPIVLLITSCAIVQTNSVDVTIYTAFKEYTTVMNAAIDVVNTIQVQETKTKVSNELLKIHLKAETLYAEARVDSSKVKEVITNLNNCALQINSLIKEFKE